MSQDQLFASFVLDQEQGLEIALRAECVTEATPVQGTIQHLPGSVPFLEGIMHLRDDVIPVINLKKRLGLDDVSYSDEAKVAVISLYNERFGLLFEDIKEVFRAESEIIAPINNALRTDDQIISALIKLEPGRRSVELLDLNHLLDAQSAELQSNQMMDFRDKEEASKPKTYSRYVVFLSNGQEYGIDVNLCREITFCTDINEMFKTGMTAGAIELRGRTIPVMNTAALLLGDSELPCTIDADTRILILANDACVIGLIIDEIKEIISIADDEILSFPQGGNENVTGLFARENQQNTILLNVQNLVCNHIDGVKSIANICNDSSTSDNDKHAESHKLTTHHLITENCYLIINIGRNFAIEIKDVKEIIENTSMLKIPGATGFNNGVINLRGEVVPVVNLRSFFRREPAPDDIQTKLIICSGQGQTIAFEVDQIVTIYKQEQYHATPSLNRDLHDRKDTVDRLIEYLNEDQIREHVLVLNVNNLLRNHLNLDGQSREQADQSFDNTIDSQDYATLSTLER